MPFVRAVDAADVPPNQAKAVQVGGRWLAIVHDAGRFFAVDHACPHAGGPLASGCVEDGKIICPVHHWPWDLETGRTGDDAHGPRLACFVVEVRDGVVFVDVEDGPASPNEHVHVG